MGLKQYFKKKFLNSTLVVIAIMSTLISLAWWGLYFWGG